MVGLYWKIIAYMAPLDPKLIRARLMDPEKVVGLCLQIVKVVGLCLQIVKVVGLCPVNNAVLQCFKGVNTPKHVSHLCGVMTARCVEAFSKAVTRLKLLRSSTVGKSVA